MCCFMRPMVMSLLTDGITGSRSWSLGFAPWWILQMNVMSHGCRGIVLGVERSSSKDVLTLLLAVSPGDKGLA